MTGMLTSSSPGSRKEEHRLLTPEVSPALPVLLMPPLPTCEAGSWDTTQTGYHLELGRMAMAMALLKVFTIVSLSQFRASNGQ